MIRSALGSCWFVSKKPFSIILRQWILLFRDSPCIITVLSVLQVGLGFQMSSVAYWMHMWFVSISSLLSLYETDLRHSSSARESAWGRKADVCVNVSLAQTPFCLCHMENWFRARVEKRSACSYQTQAYCCQHFLPLERTNPWACRCV